MNEAAIGSSQSDAVSDDGIRLRNRLLIYLSVWLLAALAFQMFLQPLGLTETDVTALEQRLWWPLYTPLMVVLGWGQAAAWPRFGFAGWAVAAALVGFVAHAGLALGCSHRTRFFVLTAIQFVLIGFGIVFFVLQSHQPTGG